MSVVRNSRRFYPYVYKWTREIDPLLPDHYKERCREFMTKDPTPVHWRPNPNRFTKQEATGARVPVQNVPVDVKYPRDCNKGLWGGEGYVIGYIKKKELAQKLPRVWRPFLQKRVLYSEILDKHFVTKVTLRTLDLIDEHFGLDFYILKTHEVDLCSKLAMDLKREMMVALAKKSCYPNNPAKRDEILDKYKDLVVSLEEAEWVGLSVDEAVTKARLDAETNNPPTPLKELFTQELAQQLSQTSITEASQSFLSKYNPFGTKSEKSEGPKS